MLENSHAWMGASSSSTIADSYQYQLQSMWQKCWNTNQSLMHHMRFRERGPLKSWRPETMAEAIFSVLKEGLSLSQAARKYDIPYPTFVLYANRVHNMLGPSIDGGPDLRPKGRGRPQRILLGIWPDEHIKGVIKTVVFRDSKDLKDDSLVPHLPYGRHSPMFPFQDGPMNYPGMSGPCPNGVPTPTGDQMSQEATAAAVAAVAHNIRQQMQLAAVVQHQHPSEGPSGSNLFNLPPHLQPQLAAATAGSSGPAPGGHGSVPLPKTSISPALSTTSNPGAGAMLGPRHTLSPCGPGLPGLPPNLPPSMAMALHMGRCDPSSVLSQQQQHQLQHLHMQQHQQQQHQQHQHQQHQQQQHALGYGVSSMPHLAGASAASIPATATTSSSHLYQQHQHQHQQQQSQIQQQHQHHQSASIGDTDPKVKCSSPASLLEHRRTSPSGESHLHSTLTELGLDIGYKTTRSSAYSPTRLFSEDLAALVGASEDSPPGTTAASTIVSSTSTVTTSAITGGRTEISITSSATSGNISSSSIKTEPITTSSE
ncbi:protein bric-a-brac 1-like [Anastrepha obliqua]|uniref:protein bric-a-brac 1-like n=1 Tax=Anastrepha obliqua TaxID=95512 RepID=UPI002409665D|nr:protein bric-a-brac 1-like [Anastrepha obliqua]XP_054734875.1 protein bric-a-brac 1-like [Anastrepha obliqua]